jgi:UDP-2-acetamido-2,6-beta-L-arabino-hexul-4-ose reductase
MNLLITGSEGFVGKNLREFLRQARPHDTLLCYDIGSGPETIADYCRQADFVFHLAGVNRPVDNGEFMTGNKGFTEEVLSYCREGKKPPVLISSSAQASMDNSYGISKKAAEDAVFSYGAANGSPVNVYRLPGVFGKWCRPNYNSVVATFCHNIAHDLPIEVRDPDFGLELVYIDDVCRAFMGALDGCVTRTDNFCIVEPTHSITLGDLADMLRSFRNSRETLQIPDMSDALTRKLYGTYISYLPDFSYPLTMHTDERGSFTEILKAPDRGQVSVNITKPGITKGNHWHHTKTEKFLVVSGQGVIRFRKVGESDITEYPVSGEALRVVDIPTGHTHTITNTGTSDLVTIMWAGELFDPQNPDTIFQPIERDVTIC